MLGSADSNLSDQQIFVLAGFILGDGLAGITTDLLGANWSKCSTRHQTDMIAVSETRPLSLDQTEILLWSSSAIPCHCHATIKTKIDNVGWLSLVLGS